MPMETKEHREKTMAPSCIILHSNDIHGRLDGLARIATLVERIRADHPDVPVLYVDAGDSEDSTNRLSNLTKGAVMHRLLSLAGCDAAVVGNAATVRYGPQVLADHAALARYPLLLANLRLSDGTPVPGVQPSMRLDLGTLRFGLIGITADDIDAYENFFGLRTPPVLPLIRDIAASLRQDGADIVVLVSHMGLPRDRKLAADLQEDVAVIIGAHTHDLLPEGERIGDVLVAQAGEYAEHLGRVDLEWDDERLDTRASIIDIDASVVPSQKLMDEIDTITREVEHFLDQIVGELAEPLDFAVDRECGVANLVADMLRERMDAEVAVVAAGQVFTEALPGGPLRRITLWDCCPSPANPGVVAMSGKQLAALIARGLNKEFARETPRQLRGVARGLMHLSGAAIRNGQLLVNGHPIELERTYRVAGTDWELEPYGGYTRSEWQLTPTFDAPTIIREALEDYLALHCPLHVTHGRLGRP